MRKFNPESPWNPARPASLSPKEYEKQVVGWLLAKGHTLEHFDVTHLEHLSGAGGDYEFDAVAEFTILSRRAHCSTGRMQAVQPAGRTREVSLWAKLQDVKAHKAMMFRSEEQTSELQSPCNLV